MTRPILFAAVALAMSTATLSAEPLTIKLQDEVTLAGDVKLRDLVADPRRLPPELQQAVVLFRDGRDSASLSIGQLETVLLEQGVRPDQLILGGSADCRITFASVAVETEHDALDAWARESGDSDWADEAAEQQRAKLAAQFDDGQALPELEPQLARALAEQLNLPVGSIRLSFDPGERGKLSRRTAVLTDIRATDLGRVSFSLDDAGSTITVRAEATAELEQTRLVRPIARGSIIHPRDLVTDIIVVDRLDQMTVDADDAIGQVAKRGLDVGSPLLAKHIEPELDIKRGQTVVVSLNQGDISLRVLCTAVSEGRTGETINVRNDATGQSLRVVVTGKQSARAQ